MKLFTCQACGQLLYFDNTRCENCGHRLGYDPHTADVLALEPVPAASGNEWRPVLGGGTFRSCLNAAADVCNWLIPAESGDDQCVACRHNRTVPDPTQAGNQDAWRRIEDAKHRLIYTLMRLGLPLPGPGEAAEPLVFDFLADAPATPKVMTGHENGLITIALSEANDAEREKRRAAMGEPYRTLLGHFRHEVGHFYWDKLVRDGGRLAECRAVFGDDEEDYEAALKRHYEEGVPHDWQEHFVSSYATTHAWEDFAETWAHYLHIVDTLETAQFFGMTVEPRVGGLGPLTTTIDVDVYGAPEVTTLVDAWIPLSFALNSLNRGMGQSDFYPFVLSPTVIWKLGFIHRLIHGHADG